MNTAPLQPHLTGPRHTVDPHHRAMQELMVPRPVSYYDGSTYAYVEQGQPPRAPPFSGAPFVRRTLHTAEPVRLWRGQFGKPVEYTCDLHNAGVEDSGDVRVVYSYN